VCVCVCVCVCSHGVDELDHSDDLHLKHQSNSEHGGSMFKLFPGAHAPLPRVCVCVCVWLAPQPAHRLSVRLRS
jgi:hypothetical protein